MVLWGLWEGNVHSYVGLWVESSVLIGDCGRGMAAPV